MGDLRPSCVIMQINKVPHVTAISRVAEISVKTKTSCRTSPRKWLLSPVSIRLL